MNYPDKTCIYAGYKDQTTFQLIGETKNLTLQTVDTLVNSKIARCRPATVKDYDIIAVCISSYDYNTVYYKEKLPWED